MNAVAPGPVLTNPAKEQLITTLGATTPLGRPAVPDEITGLVPTWLSDGATYLTGATLEVDGGRTTV